MFILQPTLQFEKHHVKGLTFVQNQMGGNTFDYNQYSPFLSVGAQ